VTHPDFRVHLLESIRALDYEIMELHSDSPDVARLEQQRENLKRELYVLLSPAEQLAA
jgi:hypothetical protein